MNKKVRLLSISIMFYSYFNCIAAIILPDKIINACNYQLGISSKKQADKEKVKPLLDDYLLVKDGITEALLRRPLREEDMDTLKKQGLSGRKVRIDFNFYEAHLNSKQREVLENVIVQEAAEKASEILHKINNE
jgi:hypothetical protein